MVFDFCLHAPLENWGCKLYIDAGCNDVVLQDFMDGEVGEIFDGFDLVATVFCNENYNKQASLFSPLYPVERSRFYVEIDSDSDCGLSLEGFQSGVADLIVRLRGYCDYVVASCDFEEYVIERTGWNWTIESPLPPA